MSRIAWWSQNHSYSLVFEKIRCTHTAHISSIFFVCLARELKVAVWAWIYFSTLDVFQILFKQSPFSNFGGTRSSHILRGTQSLQIFRGTQSFEIPCGTRSFQIFGGTRSFKKKWSLWFFFKFIFPGLGEIGEKWSVSFFKVLCTLGLLKLAKTLFY